MELVSQVVKMICSRLIQDRLQFRTIATVVLSSRAVEDNSYEHLTERFVSCQLPKLRDVGEIRRKLMAEK
jgi:hypothetical protein